MYQYFITVVPTRLVTHKISADTHQFSVTERVGKAVKPCASSFKAGASKSSVFPVGSSRSG